MTAATATLREAEAAAADAAREARAEVMERAERSSGNSKGKKAPAANADPWHRFVVDVWITNLNSVEFGIYKRSRNRAKSRQFTTDMDVFAEVIENGERTGLLSYREELWKSATGMDKRLVFKLFSENLNWRATMDLMVARSLQQTIGARGLPVMTYSINTSDDNFIVYLERSANKWPLMPEYFSFFLVDEKGSEPEFYMLRRDLINLGGDYGLYDQKGNLVGDLDGKVFSIGGKWKGRVKKGHADARLLTVLKLFTATIVFNTDCRRHLKRLYKDVRRGRLVPKIERMEADLYMNPRRVR
ncbi:MAG: hypothetical protein AB1749_06380 [Pseudomonadota bacterium]